MELAPCDDMYGLAGSHPEGAALVATAATTASTVAPSQTARVRIWNQLRARPSDSCAGAPENLTPLLDFAGEPGKRHWPGCASSRSRCSGRRRSPTRSPTSAPT